MSGYHYSPYFYWPHEMGELNNYYDFNVEGRRHGWTPNYEVYGYPYPTAGGYDPYGPMASLRDRGEFNIGGGQMNMGGYGSGGYGSYVPHDPGYPEVWTGMPTYFGEYAGGY